MTRTRAYDSWIFSKTTTKSVSYTVNFPIKLRFIPKCDILPTKCVFRWSLVYDQGILDFSLSLVEQLVVTRTLVDLSKLWLDLHTYLNGCVCNTCVEYVYWWFTHVSMWYCRTSDISVVYCLTSSVTMGIVV